MKIKVRELEKETMEGTYKTIIIGAGPAGLIAGRDLKDDFLILEKKKEIGKPIQCVGMSVESLKRQNIKENVEYVKSKIHRIERVMPNGKKIGRYKKNCIGYVVKRSSFEKYLATNIRSYIKTNVNVVDVVKDKDGTWRIVTDGDEVYRSKFVIGADGVNSVVRKKVFPKSGEKISLAFGLECSVDFSKPIDKKSIKFYLNNDIYYRGYGWFFPTSNYTANIGVGSENKNLDFEKLTEEIIKKNTKEYGNYNITNKTVGFTGSTITPFSLFQENVFLVGDAAGLNDPIFRAGTNQAMISANLASECINKNKPHEYSKKIESLPFTNFRIRKSSNIFYGLSNELLNEIGDSLEGKSFSDVKNISFFIKVLKKKKIRNSIFKILYFFKNWEKSKKWLW